MCARYCDQLLLAAQNLSKVAMFVECIAQLQACASEGTEDQVQKGDVVDHLLADVMVQDWAAWRPGVRLLHSTKQDRVSRKSSNREDELWIRASRLTHSAGC